MALGFFSFLIWGQASYLSKLLPFKLGLRSPSASPSPISCERWGGGGVTGARVQGFLPQEVTQQSFHPLSLQSRTCPQEDPVLPRLHSRSALASGQSRAGGCQHLVMSRLTLSFASSEVGGEEPGRPATSDFLCLLNGFLGCS